MIKTDLTFNEVQSKLAGYYGTEHYYKITPFNDMVITDGIKAFADMCECYWLITDFVAHKLYPITKKEDDTFCIVEFTVKNHSVKMRAFHDTNKPNFWEDRQKDYGQTIPEGTYQFYLIDDVMLLKSEY